MLSTVVTLIRVAKDFGGSPFDPIDQIARRGACREFGITLWLDTEFRESFKDGFIAGNLIQE
jgi:hypothetical protein